MDVTLSEIASRNSTDVVGHAREERDRTSLQIADNLTICNVRSTGSCQSSGDCTGCDSPVECREAQALAYIASLPPIASVVSRPEVCLPEKRASRPEKTLVLDLDETLVHCSTETMEKSDLTFPVLFRGVEYKVFVRRRPHLEHFLTTMSTLFEVVVFTASHRVYADRLLDILDPMNKFFDHRIFRDSCVLYVGNYVKDLSVLGRDLSHTVIIDNSPQAFGFHIDNGIPISTWQKEERDEELLNLIPLLKEIANADDVRCLVREKFGLSEMVKHFKERQSSNRDLATVFVDRTQSD